MVPGCPEHCNVEGTLGEYSRNIACQLGGIQDVQCHANYETPSSFESRSLRA